MFWKIMNLRLSKFHYIENPLIMLYFVHLGCAHVPIRGMGNLHLQNAKGMIIVSSSCLK